MYIFLLQIETTKTSTTLTIKQAFPEDSGLITCRLKNKFGMTECSAELYVQGKWFDWFKPGHVTILKWDDWSNPITWLFWDHCIGWNVKLKLCWLQLWDASFEVSLCIVLVKWHISFKNAAWYKLWFQRLKHKTSKCINSWS